MSRAPDLTHIDTWLFDLDNTLYPPEAEFMSLIEGRMTRFVVRETGLPSDQAYALQKRYLHEHGTTLAGLMANHGVNPEAFLDEVHDVSMASLHPDPELRAAIEALPGRRLVFTNGDRRHAERVLAKLQLDDLFEATFHIALADYIPKPYPQTFARMIAAHDIDPRRTAFFEDSARNLPPAHDLGMTTVLVGPAGADPAPTSFIIEPQISRPSSSRSASRRSPHERPSVYDRSGLGRARRRQPADPGRGARSGGRGPGPARFR